MVQELSNALNVGFQSVPTYGQNPQIFNYQVVEGGHRCKYIYRLCFYEGTKVCVIVGREGRD